MKISAKIVNGNLIVRVGGGFMSIDEFIQKHAENEIKKLMLQYEKEQQEEIL
jgi:hypothetical protein